MDKVAHMECIPQPLPSYKKVTYGNSQGHHHINQDLLVFICMSKFKPTFSQDACCPGSPESPTKASSQPLILFLLIQYFLLPLHHAHCGRLISPHRNQNQAYMMTKEMTGFTVTTRQERQILFQFHVPLSVGIHLPKKFVILVFKTIYGL